MSQIEYDSDTTKIVQSLLPANEAPHCVGASVKGTVVVLMADSAAWASRLRFRKKALLANLQQIQRFALVQDIIFITNATVADRVSRQVRA